MLSKQKQSPTAAAPADAEKVRRLLKRSENRGIAHEIAVSEEITDQAVSYHLRRGTLHILELACQKIAERRVRESCTQEHLRRSIKKLG